MAASLGFDLAIAGGGLVGCSLAVALHGSGRRVALIEPALPAAAAPAWDERCIGLNDATVRIFRSLGLWPAMRAEATPILATHVSEQGRFGVARFAAQEAGLDALGYNIPLRAIRSALLQRIGQTDAAAMLCPARVDAVEVDAGGVRLRGEGIDGELRAALLVAADGTNSPLRQHFGIATEARDYGQTAIVTTVPCAREHGGVAHERFTAGGPLALLPRPGRACTVVWTQPSAPAQALMELPDEDFREALQSAFGHRLGRFGGVGRRMPWPLRQVLATRVVAERTVFVGNAAQTVHPVVAQGFNLGLRDVATLAELVRQHEDPGGARLLADYAARRRDDRRQVAEFTDGLVRLFSNRLPGLAALRHLGLVAINLAGPARRRLMQRSLGYGGLTPAAARSEP